MPLLGVDHPTRGSEMSNYPELGAEEYLAALDQVTLGHLSGLGALWPLENAGLVCSIHSRKWSPELTLSHRLGPTTFLRCRDTT